MSFNDKNNLRLIWEILSEAVEIQEKPDNQKQIIYNLFQSHLNTFNKTNKNEKNLMSKNKSFISEVLQIIQANESQTLEKNTQLNKLMFKDLIGNDITSQDIKDSRKVKFEESLKLHQNNFNEFTNKISPTEIDFRLPMDEEPLLDATTLVKQLASERKYETEIKIPPTASTINNNNNNNLVNSSLPSVPYTNTPMNPVTQPNSINQSNPNIKILTIDKNEYVPIDQIANVSKLNQLDKETTSIDILNKNIEILNTSILKLIEVLNNNTNEEDSS